MDTATLLAASCAVLAVCLGMMLLGGDSRATRRMQEVATSGAEGGRKGGLLSFMKVEDNTQRRKQIEDSLSKIEEDQKSKKKERNTLTAKLIQADWSVSAQNFTIISLAIGFVIGGLALLLTQKPLFGAAFAIIFGLGMPRWILGFAIGRRQKKFTHNFADAMDIIVRGVRTGLPLNDCLKIIAHESPEPIKTEFRRLVEAESVGVPIEICLERMYERVPLSEVNFFATVLNIQKTTGGNLGESLANLSNVLRGRKMLREKIKALSAEAKMSAIIIGALPIVVMIIVGLANPDYMADLLYTKTGQRNLMIGGVLMVMGTVTMKKMINFKI